MQCTNRLSGSYYRHLVCPRLTSRAHGTLAWGFQSGRSDAPKRRRWLSLNVAAAPEAAPDEENRRDLVSTIRPLRPFFLLLYLGLSILAMVIGYMMHPTLLMLTASFWGIKPSVDDFESSFFGLLSIVYSVFAGQTFLFLFERQINMVQELYGEVFALELLVQQTFLVCHSQELKGQLAAAVRTYMREEVYTPEDMSSPFRKTGPYMAILQILARMKGQGVVVTSLVEACRQLADAQSRRSAMAAQILPTVHWVFMHGMELIFVFTFLVFDASELDMSVGAVDVPEERRLFFGALFGLLALTTQVLKDLDDPLSGLYAFRGALDERTDFLESLLVELEEKPANYVPSSVETLRLLGLIDSHVDDTSTHPPTKVVMGSTPLTTLRVPVSMRTRGGTEEVGNHAMLEGTREGV